MKKWNGFTISKRVRHHPTSRIGFVAFGVVEVIDGIIRILTFGLLFSNAPLLVSKSQAERAISNRKKSRAVLSK